MRVIGSAVYSEFRGGAPFWSRFVLLCSLSVIANSRCGVIAAATPNEKTPLDQPTRAGLFSFGSIAPDALLKPSDSTAFSRASAYYETARTAEAFQELVTCANEDPKCRSMLGDFHYLGLAPLSKPNLVSALLLWKTASDRGSADAQYRLAIVYGNYFGVPNFATACAFDAAGAVGVTTEVSSPRSGDTALPSLPGEVDLARCEHQAELIATVSPTEDGSEEENVATDGVPGETRKSAPVLSASERVLSYFDGKVHPNGSVDFPTRFLHLKPQLEEFESRCVSTQAVSGHLKFDDALAVAYLYSASMARHPGASMALGFRHERGAGVERSCTTATSYYLQIARHFSGISSPGMPQAVELVRLALPSTSKHQKMKFQRLELHLHVAERGYSKIQGAVGRKYLLGVEGFPQDYTEAGRHLASSAAQGNGEAIALLGYVYALGLGVPADLDKASELFYEAAVYHNEPPGFNGLGYINFVGTPNIERNISNAFWYFQTAAGAGFPDAQFNLGALYFTGNGVAQSFEKAMMWFTKALEQGHGPAAYTLSLLHLNGLGTAPDCNVAVALAKRVCELGSWVSGGLQKAYEHSSQGRDPEAAFVFLQLAEAGHEVSQSNIAHLLDVQSSSVMHSPYRDVNRVYAQRFYELSANQWSIVSELRLGDFAYYGWGLDTQSERTANGASKLDALVDPDGNSLKDWFGTAHVTLTKLEQPNFARAWAHYKKASEMPTAARWNSFFAAKALHNLGHMYQYGLGVPTDFGMARRCFEDVLTIDESIPGALVAISLAMLTAYEMWSNLDMLWIRKLIVADRRFRILGTNFLFMIALWMTRPVLVATAARARLRLQRQVAAAADGPEHMGVDVPKGEEEDPTPDLAADD